jgi:predicted site-specific integrase-resolvase
MPELAGGEHMEKLLTERETAELLRISVQLLRKWRASGTGLKHKKLGKCVRYSLDEVKRYLSSI